MLDQVEAIVKSTPRHAYNYGLHAYFHKIDDEWGLKFYDDEEIRDKTYYLQSMAADIGCAPRLGEIFDMVTPRGDKVYGYITECLETVGHKMDISLSKYRTLEDELVNKLERIMEVRDMHDGNVGMMADGRFVAIDFSLCKFLEE